MLILVSVSASLRDAAQVGDAVIYLQLQIRDAKTQSSTYITRIRDAFKQATLLNEWHTKKMLRGNMRASPNEADTVLKLAMSYKVILVLLY